MRKPVVANFNNVRIAVDNIAYIYRDLDKVYVKTRDNQEHRIELTIDHATEIYQSALEAAQPVVLVKFNEGSGIECVEPLDGKF